MRKSFLAAGTALLAFSALSVATHARDLTVVSWGGAYQDAQREAYFGPYTKASGNKVLDEAYNGETAKIKAMVETNNVTWDVVQMEAPELENSCDEGLLEVVNWEKLGGQDTVIEPAIIGECGVGTILWSVILAYDSEKLGQDGPKSWADMWDVKKWPGKRALRKTAKFTLEIALMADGVPADKVYETLATKEGIDRAFKKLDEIKEHIQWWES
ncbi:MAG TPA: spermidine/putrescine ABC transporter substrate-binding protein, partial [Rhizobiales bacterium]|nr:spermidine/putrescine ABC transporter substrate-binding protein [Hyphomicrobiales bacterium]